MVAFGWKGTDPEEFEFLEGGGDFSLAPTETHTVRVRFCPLSVGSKAAVLHIVSNDPDENPCDLPLDGTGIGGAQHQLRRPSQLRL